MQDKHINYITPNGHQSLQNELYVLVNKERGEVVQVVNWAAGNGDRSENGDYIYGKRRLREIDRRIRFLIKRLESAVIIDPEARESSNQVFFGATVSLNRSQLGEQVVCIVGVDEVDVSRNKISWISPLAQCLLKAHEGDEVLFSGPDGEEWIEIVDVAYLAIP